MPYLPYISWLRLVQLARFHRFACCVISCVCRTIAPFRWDWATAKHSLSPSLSFCLSLFVWWQKFGTWQKPERAGNVGGGRRVAELALSRDVGRKMASRNNDAYIYEIYAWHPLQFDDFSSRVCVCVRDAYQQAAKLEKPPARFCFFSLIFNLNKRKVFFLPSTSQGVFIAAQTKGAWQGKRSNKKVSHEHNKMA